MTVVTDTGIVLRRQLRPMSRDPFTARLRRSCSRSSSSSSTGRSLIGMGGGVRDSPWQWFVPGIIVMVSLFGTSVAGAYLLEEMRVGAFERFLVTPLDRSSLLVGRALKDVVPLMLQALLIVALVTPFGFELHLGRRSPSGS